MRSDELLLIAHVRFSTRHFSNRQWLRRTGSRRLGFSTEIAFAAPQAAQSAGPMGR